ncbi:MAG: hypothetical protein BJ554DRAFT_325 [Olpidium bornovanus]|uniref:Uncharacterized protein n=1 Tax=Olpidium bornovanus TaxID=278681 RepID=A0A8H7ZUJ0_9FUNG|nr:MAG: hypothetical protein BJ554DRAFT_325 [Olpidium bornovanus]
MNIATVLDSSEPVSMMRKQSGIISVESRKLTTSELSFCSAEKNKSAGLILPLPTGRARATKPDAVTHFHQSTNYPQTRQTQILERPDFARGAQKRIQK